MRDLLCALLFGLLAVAIFDGLSIRVTVDGKPVEYVIGIGRGIEPTPAVELRGAP